MSEKMRDSDADNLVTVDRRDLFDFVRSAIKDALSTEDEAMHDESWLWAESTYRTDKALGKLALRTHENGGQESEAEHVGWRYKYVFEGEEVIELDPTLNRPLSPAITPDATIELYDIAPVYLASPSASAIEAAAIMKCAELLDEKSEAGYTPDWFVAKTAILALITQDGRTALFDKCLEVAHAILDARRDGLLDGNDIRAIVTNLIGVPPLNSESVSGEGK